jgi:nucleoside-diphosphate-sugar epimerase
LKAGHEVKGTGRGDLPSEKWPAPYYPGGDSPASFAEILEDFSPHAIIHCAGSSPVGDSFNAPLEDFKASVESWVKLLEGVRQKRMHPVLFFPSSAAVYGNPATLPVNEDAPVNPISPYGFHKAACELAAREYSTCFGLNTIVCRLFSVFGEEQRRLLIWELFQQLDGPEMQVRLQGTGRESRDYLYIDDLAAAFLGLIENVRASKERGRYLQVNVARGESITVLEAALLIERLLDSEKEILTSDNGRQGDPQQWEADISLFKRTVPDWKPAPFTESLERCLKTWRGEAERENG